MQNTLRSFNIYIYISLCFSYTHWSFAIGTSQIQQLFLLSHFNNGCILPTHLHDLLWSLGPGYSQARWWFQPRNEKNILLKYRGHDSSFPAFFLSENNQSLCKNISNIITFLRSPFGHATTCYCPQKPPKIQAPNPKELPTEGLLSGKIAAVLNIWVTLIGVLG